MDEFIDKLAEALKAEFPFLNGPGTAPDAFRKAAAGIAAKMGVTCDPGDVSQATRFYVEGIE